MVWSAEEGRKVEGREKGRKEKREMGAGRREKENNVALVAQCRLFGFDRNTGKSIHIERYMYEYE